MTESIGAIPAEPTSQGNALTTESPEAGATRVSRVLLADGALLLVTVVWGATFVMVKDAVAAFPVFTFLSIRFALAAAALAPLALRRKATGGRLRGPHGARTPGTLVAPALIGTALFAGYALQTAGLRLTTPAKAGFITGLSVVIVSVISALALRQPPSRNAWIGVGLATAGLGLLSLQAGLTIEPGDLLVLGCAVAFAAHVLLTGRFARRYDPLWLTLGQIVTVVVLSGVAALLFDPPAPLTGRVLFAAGFTGLLATAAAFGIQTLAQRLTTATHTALIISAEPVFAGLFSYLLIGELLGPRQIIGCALILLGMLIAELRRR